MDGARWTETFGGGATNIPYLNNDMRPYGTLYTNFRIDQNSGVYYTLTCPGHATIETGTWQTIFNDGTQRPTLPTIFEYYRKTYPLEDKYSCYVVTGKSKLGILTYSTDSEYGSDYGGTWDGDDNKIDATTYAKAITVMQTYQPKILVINFAEIDVAGHSGNETNYLNAIKNADSYINQLWQHVQNGDYGYNINNTTLFITNDHGRHTTNFADHGDGCEGCTHIMLLALGRNVIPQVITDIAYQRDIAPTVGDLLGFSTPHITGSSLYEGNSPLPIELFSFSANVINNSVKISWMTKTEINNYGFDLERKTNFTQWKKVGFVNGNGNSNSPKTYSFSDNNPSGGSKFLYRLKQIDNDGQFEYSDAVEVMLIPMEYTLYQNYPNPFNPSTKIKFALPEAGKVVLKIYDMTGAEVAELVNTDYEAGYYDIDLNLSNLSSGVYLYRLQSKGFSQVKKLVILR
jgi:hypothetical protein